MVQVGVVWWGEGGVKERAAHLATRSFRARAWRRHREASTQSQQCPNAVAARRQRLGLVRGRRALGNVEIVPAGGGEGWFVVGLGLALGLGLGRGRGRGWG